MTDLVNHATAVVQRYGGAVDKFTGDGVMAVFGAPVAFEDHALRACRAALDIHKEVQHLAANVQNRDGHAFQLRIGLNSGQVVAGEISSSTVGYTAIGDQVGMAQRMESVAPPGGVMLTESTARLVEATAALGEPQFVRIKGRDDAVPARLLHAITARRERPDRWQPTLVGRQTQMRTIAAALERSTAGHGAVVRIVGVPGIGKSRLVSESVALARNRGADVFVTFCEALAKDISFHAVANLLRAAYGVIDLPDASARQEVRSRFPDADSDDLRLLDDLLGVADHDAALPDIDPDARRRRLTALINTGQLARTNPAVYVIEDVHWIDEVSESMLADFLTVIPQSQSMVLIAYRPEYDGVLTRAGDAESITLAPLDFSQSSALTAELLGSDSSVAQIAAMVTEHAAGNPFFAEEIVRDLADRDIIAGSRCNYLCHTDIGDISVPATLQAAIAARIDRLGQDAKRTVRAAAVIGSRFTPDLLVALGIDPAIDLLAKAELIDAVGTGPPPQYEFRHPLIRTVAYESQLKTDRAELHRRLAAAIEQREVSAVDANASLIAEHLDAAGDLQGAYAWHMRAAGWLTNRDISGARSSWRRAQTVADRLPDDDPHVNAMRIASRTFLCATAYRVGGSVANVGFDELRDLTGVSDDKRSLSMGMSGFVMALTVHSRHRESSRMASECMALFESIGDPVLTVGLAFPLILAKYEAGDMTEALSMAERAIELADGDPTLGNLVFGSPLSLLLAIRGTVRYRMGDPAWRDDADRAVEMARDYDPACLVFAVMYKYLGIAGGALLPDDAALQDTAEALQLAERSGDDFALAAAQFVRGVTLLYGGDEDREAGLDLLRLTRDACLRERFSTTTLAFIDSRFAKEQARKGDLEGAIESVRSVLSRMFDTGETFTRSGVASVLIELLLTRARGVDLQEARGILDSLDTSNNAENVLDEMISLVLRAALARTEGDEIVSRNLAERIRAMATSLDAQGFIALADAMT